MRRARLKMGDKTGKEGEIMASLSVDGAAALQLSHEQLASLPDSMLDEMLDAEAEVVERAQKNKGRSYGVYRTGMTLESIKRGKKRKTKDGRAVEVAPQGKNARGSRNAEIAFLNEYGVPKRGIAARPFIRDANEACADEAVQKAYKVYDDYLNKKGL